jgi:hypothetical protein
VENKTRPCTEHIHWDSVATIGSQVLFRRKLETSKLKNIGAVKIKIVGF